MFLLGLRAFRMAEPPAGATVAQVRRFGRLLMMASTAMLIFLVAIVHPRRPQAGAEPMKRALSFRRIGKTAGIIILGLIILDVVATTATLALGARMIQR